MKFIFNKKKHRVLDEILLRKQNRSRECVAKRVYWLHGCMRFTFSKFDRIKLWILLGATASSRAYQSVRVIISI